MPLEPSSGWSYCKEINISDTAGVSANYQMKLTIYAGEGDDNTASDVIYCDNHCLNFPNDIRFGTTNNPSTATQLAQWIEYQDSIKVVLWIKLPADGSDTFYMFVGNSSADLYSDGESTFDYFIDMSQDDPTDNPEWSFDGYYAYENGYLRLGELHDNHGGDAFLDLTNSAVYGASRSKVAILVKHNPLGEEGDYEGRYHYVRPWIDSDNYHGVEWGNYGSPPFRLVKRVSGTREEYLTDSTNLTYEDKDRFWLLKVKDDYAYFKKWDYDGTNVYEKYGNPSNTTTLEFTSINLHEWQANWAVKIVALLKYEVSEPTFSSFGHWTSIGLEPSSGWAYRKQLTISDTANVSADYQMKLIVYAGNGSDNTATGEIYCDNHCINFPDDIRFGTASDPSIAIQLPQWIESYDPTMAIIWVKLPSDGSDTIYMFIGNSSASEYSDGENTFIYFTHFDTDKSSDFRTVGSANFTWETSYSRLKGTYTANTWHMYQLKSSFPRPFAIESKFMQNYLDWHCDGGIGYGKSSTTQIDSYDEIEGYHFNLRSSDHMTLRVTKTSGCENYNTNNGTLSTNTWYRITLKIGISDIYGYVIDDNGNLLEVSHSDVTYDNLYPGVDADIDGGVVYWDFFLIRKYASTEPLWSTFGSWEEITVSRYKVNTITHREILVSHALQAYIEELAKNRRVLFDLISRKQLLLDFVFTSIFNEKKTKAHFFDSHFISHHKISTPISVRLIQERKPNLKIKLKDGEKAWVMCSRWDEENWNVIVEFIAPSSARNSIIENINPGAVAELYNILGEPKFIDTTYSSGNTLWLIPEEGWSLYDLRDPVKIAVKRYSETMLRWDLFKIRIEGVKL